jgi:transposase-like protein
MTQLCKSSPTLFKRRHFDREIIILCVRWYLTYKLSYRDLKAMMAERGIDVAHTTILRWVQCYVPMFEKHWHRYAQSVGPSWRVDATYIKVRGKWAYLYRYVDKKGQTVDFFFSARRDIAAAKQFLQQVIEKRGIPQKITLDGDAASHEAVRELQEEKVLPVELVVRTNRYLNNLIEQDHRRVKQRGRPRLGFQRFDYAGVTIAGIELTHQIKKGQFDVSVLCPHRSRTPQIWEAVLAA